MFAAVGRAKALCYQWEPSTIFILTTDLSTPALLAYDLHQTLQQAVIFAGLTKFCTSIKPPPEVTYLQKSTNC